MADQYLLRVTAGPSYDVSTHTDVAVNSSTSTEIKGSQCTANVKVRIQNYRGLPRGSPKTSAYFSHPPHEHDQYSIAFSMVPHATVSADDLVFGNDFDRPIRDRLPPGFSIAFGIVKRLIDPGLDGDPYADKPYLYGPLLSSINLLSIGGKLDKKGGSAFEIPPDVHEDGIREGADGQDGEKARADSGLPEDAAKRKSWALQQPNREKFSWEEGRIYRGDFFNPYIDFNDFSLKLPGFSLGMLKYLDGAEALRRSHDLRYTLKNRKTGEVFFVVVLTLLKKEDVEKEEETAKSGKASEGKPGNDDDDEVD